MRKIFTLSVLTVLLGFAAHNSQAQTMTCSQQTNISVNSSCTVTVTPGMVSTGAPLGSTVTVMNGTTIVTQPLNSTHVGKFWTVKVQAPTGNVCWGTIKVEDKAPPTLTCAASPQNVNCAIQNLNISNTPKVVFDNIANNTIPDIDIAASIFGNPLVAENCGYYTLSYSDQVIDKDCNTVGISAVVTRTWVAADIYGNASTCTVVYNLQRQPLSAVVFPTDVTINCNQTVALDANGNPAVSFAKSPTINNVEIFPIMAGFCEINASYHDKKTVTCGSTYEIIRKWTVIDMCNFTVATSNQVIKIVDNQAPIFTNCPLSDLTVSTNGNNCDLDNYPIPAVTLTDNCDNQPSFTASISQNGLAVAGGNIVSNLTIGDYIITYTANDACGNTNTCTRKLAVRDLAPPVAVCDLNTKVAITTNGTAYLPAIDVDDNSTDNCCIDLNRFEIKRAADSDLTYNKELLLNCNDKNIMVALRVWDCNNNSNVCMVNVLVEDKLPPIAFGRDTVVCCANTPSGTAWLDINPLKVKTISDLPNATNPGYFDNCDAIATKTTSGTIDNCGNGTVKHIWNVKDEAGFSATTEVRYISENRSAYTVTFPADVTLTCNNNQQYATDPTSAGKPNINALAGTCPLVGVEYTDNVFTVVPDACFKIIRTWKVLNWCQPLSQANDKAEKGEVRKTGNACSIQDRTYTNIYEFRPDGVSSIYAPNAPCSDLMNALKNAEGCYKYDTDGYMEYTQIIKVIDLTPPTLFAGNVTQSPIGKECKTTLNIGYPTSTDCTGSTEDSYEIIKKSNNTIVASGKNFPATRDFIDSEFGDYVVRYKTTDQCGNYTSLDVPVTIKDTKKPTPVCHNWISTNLMLNGMVMIDAKILDAGSYDNCTIPSKLKFKIQVPPPTANNMPNPDTLKGMHTFTCADTAIIPVDDKMGYLASVALWVGDEAGNWDYCETIIHVQDNNVVCNYIPIQMKNLAGAINTEKNIPVENVNMLLNGTKQQQIFSNLTGKIIFKDLPILGNYTVVPEKIEQPLNGVSTLDLVLMSKHILGTQPLQSPYQMIAADINKSGTISTADIVEVRKMILGTQGSFSKNNSWRFVDKKFTFASNQNPLQQAFPESKQFTGISGNESADFIAVKIGDINGNANTNSTSTGRSELQSLTVKTDDKIYQKGDEISVNFKAAQEIEGYQSTINFDKNNLELVEIIGNKENFAVIENGLITVSCVNSAATNEMFTLVFRAKGNGILSENIRFSEQITSKEAYNLNGEIFNLSLDFNNKINGTELVLFQNRPNPFQNETTISFQLPYAGEAKISISDAAGKVIQVIENTYEKGYNEVKLNKSNLNINGLLYIQLEQNGLKVSKKMISID